MVSSRNIKDNKTAASLIIVLLLCLVFLTSGAKEPSSAPLEKGPDCDAHYGHDGEAPCASTDMPVCEGMTDEFYGQCAPGLPPRRQQATSPSRVTMQPLAPEKEPGVMALQGAAQTPFDTTKAVDGPGLNTAERLPSEPSDADRRENVYLWSEHKVGGTVETLVYKLQLTTLEPLLLERKAQKMTHISVPPGKEVWLFRNTGMENSYKQYLAKQKNRRPAKNLPGRLQHSGGAEGEKHDLKALGLITKRLVKFKSYQVVDAGVWETTFGPPLKTICDASSRASCAFNGTRFDLQCGEYVVDTDVWGYDGPNAKRNCEHAMNTPGRCKIECKKQEELTVCHNPESADHVCKWGPDAPKGQKWVACQKWETVEDGAADADPAADGCYYYCTKDFALKREPGVKCEDEAGNAGVWRKCFCPKDNAHGLGMWQKLKGLCSAKAEQPRIDRASYLPVPAGGQASKDGAATFEYAVHLCEGSKKCTGVYHERSSGRYFPLMKELSAPTPQARCKPEKVPDSTLVTVFSKKTGKYCTYSEGQPRPEVGGGVYADKRGGYVYCESDGDKLKGGEAFVMKYVGNEKWEMVAANDEPGQYKGQRARQVKFDGRHPDTIAFDGPDASLNPLPVRTELAETVERKTEEARNGASKKMGRRGKKKHNKKQNSKPKPKPSSNQPKRCRGGCKGGGKKPAATVQIIKDRQDKVKMMTAEMLGPPAIKGLDRSHHLVERYWNYMCTTLGASSKEYERKRNKRRSGEAQREKENKLKCSRYYSAYKNFDPNYKRGPVAQFYVEPKGQSVCLKLASNGKYCAVENDDPKAGIRCNRDKCESWEEFTMLPDEQRNTLSGGYGGEFPFTPMEQSGAGNVTYALNRTLYDAREENERTANDFSPYTLGQRQLRSTLSRKDRTILGIQLRDRDAAEDLRRERVLQQAGTTFHEHENFDGEDTDPTKLMKPSMFGQKHMISGGMSRNLSSVQVAEGLELILYSDEGEKLTIPGPAKIKDLKTACGKFRKECRKNFSDLFTKYAIRYREATRKMTNFYLRQGTDEKRVNGQVLLERKLCRSTKDGLTCDVSNPNEAQRFTAEHEMDQRYYISCGDGKYWKFVKSEGKDDRGVIKCEPKKSRSWCDQAKGKDEQECHSYLFNVQTRPNDNNRVSIKEYSYKGSGEGADEMWACGIDVMTSRVVCKRGNSETGGAEGFLLHPEEGGCFPNCGL